MKTEQINSFSEKSLEALSGFYVYALIDPRNEQTFYIGKGTNNRIFAHEKESVLSDDREKAKLCRIREIEADGFAVKRLIVNWGLTESEAFAAEASLINILNYMPNISLTNAVSGHHSGGCLTVEEFELLYGAVPLNPDDIKHSVMVIKINKMYQRGMPSDELYDVVRGFWKTSLTAIKRRKVEYVFGVYNGLIVAVYKPDEWHYVYEMKDIPKRIYNEDYEHLKNRVYFACKDYNNLDEPGCFYINKSIENLKVSQSAQNPITYLSLADTTE